MTQAFSTSITGGKQFDDVLKSLALRISDLAVRARLQAAGEIARQRHLGSAVGPDRQRRRRRSSSLAAASGAIKPFASGGVIGTPTYFPLANGGIGPCRRSRPRSDHAADARPRRPARRRGRRRRRQHHQLQIATPDLDSFRRSESYITGQIARAVARGQRSL